MPDEQPVTKATLPESFPLRFSSLMICRAVGRASPGPFGDSWTAAYLEVMIEVWWSWVGKSRE
jgi:hypothetical protein